MITTTIRNQVCSSASEILCLAFELGVRAWKLFFTFAHAQKPRERTVAAEQHNLFRNENHTIEVLRHQAT